MGGGKNKETENFTLRTPRTNTGRHGRKGWTMVTNNNDNGHDDAVESGRRQHQQSQPRQNHRRQSRRRRRHQQSSATSSQERRRRDSCGSLILCPFTSISSFAQKFWIHFCGTDHNSVSLLYSNLAIDVCLLIGAGGIYAEGGLPQVFFSNPNSYTIKPSSSNQTRGCTTAFFWP